MTPHPHLTETCITSQPVFDGVVLKLRVDTVRLPDGGQGLREVATHPGGVVVMPVMPDGKVVLVRQFRYSVGHTLLEFPAGKLDTSPTTGQKEDPLLAAKRELQEETGYVAQHWTPLHSIHTAPGFTNERLYLYRAEGLTLAERLTQPDEFVETVMLTLDELLHGVKQGEVTDAKTLCLLAWACIPGLGKP
jgi:ADP-ribose pyrophosphatase